MYVLFSRHSTVHLGPERLYLELNHKDSTAVYGAIQQRRLKHNSFKRTNIKLWFALLLKITSGNFLSPAKTLTEQKQPIPI